VDNNEQALVEVWRAVQQLGRIYELKNTKADVWVTISSDGSCMLGCDQMHGETFESFHAVLEYLKEEIRMEGVEGHDG
jgi:hypothetical protein